LGQEPVGDRTVKGEGEEGNTVKYFIHMYENRIRRPIKIGLNGGYEWIIEMVNLIKVH
jgi:hypothetical protein